MNVKEQLAMYKKALAAEEANRSEVLAQFDTRIANLKSLISGLSNPAIAAQGGLDAGVETPKRKGKASTAPAPTKAVKKAVKKPVKTYTRATTVSRGKKNPDIPRLEDAMQIVMGSKELSAPEIHAEIKARHWIPASKDPLGYIRYALSANGAIFLRREEVRGRYHLDPKNPYASGKHKVPIEGHVNPKTKKRSKQGEELEVESIVEPPSMNSVEVASTSADVVVVRREDPKSVVDELLRDGGESAFGRQAPIAARTE
jgi:hypothetical protein